MRKLLLGTLLAIVTAAAIVFWFISYQNGKIESLYAAAVGRPGYWRSSLESVEAVKKLARYKGERSSRLLLDVAMNKERTSVRLVWPLYFNLTMHWLSAQQPHTA